MPSENQSAAASYILSFYRDIEELTNYNANYCNAVLQLKEKHGKDANTTNLVERLDDTEKAQILAIIQTTRFWGIRTYIKLCSLSEKIKALQKSVKEIQAPYEKLIGASTPDYSVVQDFTLAMNKIFVLEIMADLFVNAQDIYKQAFSAENEG